MQEPPATQSNKIIIIYSNFLYWNYFAGIGADAILACLPPSHNSSTATTTHISSNSNSTPTPTPNILLVFIVLFS